MRKVNYGRYSRQYAVIYILYMMIGSLFHKCSYKNPGTERYLYLHFVEMPEKKELETEDNILKAIDQLDEDFKGNLADLNCEIFLQKDEDEYCIFFQTEGFEGLDVLVNQEGKFKIKQTNNKTFTLD